MVAGARQHIPGWSGFGDPPSRPYLLLEAMSPIGLCPCALARRVTTLDQSSWGRWRALIPSRGYRRRGIRFDGPFGDAGNTQVQAFTGGATLAAPARWTVSPFVLAGGRGYIPEAATPQR